MFLPTTIFISGFEEMVDLDAKNIVNASKENAKGIVRGRELSGCRCVAFSVCLYLWFSPYLFLSHNQFIFSSLFIFCIFLAFQKCICKNVHKYRQFETFRMGGRAWEDAVSGREILPSNLPAAGRCLSLRLCQVRYVFVNRQNVKDSLQKQLVCVCLNVFVR